VRRARRSGPACRASRWSRHSPCLPVLHRACCVSVHVAPPSLARFAIMLPAERGQGTPFPTAGPALYRLFQRPSCLCCSPAAASPRAVPAGQQHPQRRRHPAAAHGLPPLAPLPPLPVAALQQPRGIAILLLSSGPRADVDKETHPCWFTAVSVRAAGCASAISLLGASPLLLVCYVLSDRSLPLAATARAIQVGPGGRWGRRQRVGGLNVCCAAPQGST
jgi:hypothetical protein